MDTTKVPSKGYISSTDHEFDTTEVPSIELGWQGFQGLAKWIHYCVTVAKYDEDERVEVPFAS